MEAPGDAPQAEAAGFGASTPPPHTQQRCAICFPFYGISAACGSAHPPARHSRPQTHCSPRLNPWMKRRTSWRPPAPRRRARPGRVVPDAQTLTAPPQAEPFGECDYDSLTVTQIAALARMRIADERRREEVLRVKQVNAVWEKQQVPSLSKPAPRSAPQSPHTQPHRPHMPSW